MKNKRLYTKEEDEFIIENYKSMTYKEMAKILQREEYSLQKRARKLGISKVNTNIGFTEIMLEDNDEPEVWKDIPGYEGIYMVSNYGRILSVERKDKNGYRRGSRILIAHKSNRGYKHLGLSKDNKVVQFLVHTLVAMAFLENPYNLPIVNHKDENPSNNFYKNLEWCSYKYNINYGSHNEKSAKSTSREVLQYDLEGNFIREYYSVGHAAKINGLNKKQILRCCSEYRKRVDGTSNHVYGNYYWEYKDKTKKSVKSVIQYDVDMNEIGRYASATDAAKAIGVKPYGIIDCCKGLTKTSHGYKWRYENEN